MSLTVTIPAVCDPVVLRTRLMKQSPALSGGMVYDQNGDQLTIYALNETDRIAIQQIIDACATSQTERQAVVNAYQANLDFLALSAPTNAQVLAQVKALTRQVNYLAKELL